MLVVFPPFPPPLRKSRRHEPLARPRRGHFLAALPGHSLRLELFCQAALRRLRLDEFPGQLVVQPGHLLPGPGGGRRRHSLAAFRSAETRLLGGVLFGLGYLLAAVALHHHSLLLLYLGYGVVGGTGLGLGYVTPVATVAKWFPDRKGLATGIVIMGFGFGALLMSVSSPRPCCTASAATWPPSSPGWGSFWAGQAPRRPCCCKIRVNETNREKKANAPAAVAEPGVSIFSSRFLLMWSVFFCNIVAGISIISFQSPLFQDLWRAKNAALSTATLAAYGASLIAASSIFNGLGRMFWGGLSDHLRPLRTFRLMLASQIAVLAFLAVAGNPWLFAAAVCYVLLCYGGGFGTMPSFVLDEFGARRMAIVYGAILTAWSAGGIVGPQDRRDAQGPLRGGRFPLQFRRRRRVRRLGVGPVAPAADDQKTACPLRPPFAFQGEPRNNPLLSSLYLAF